MEWSSVLTSIVALVFVVSLILLISTLMKKYGANRIFAEAGNSEKRLSIKEVLVIDGRRKLILLARDDTEHLIMISGDKELVIESGIDIELASNVVSSKDVVE